MTVINTLFIIQILCSLFMFGAFTIINKSKHMKEFDDSLKELILDSYPQDTILFEEVEVNKKAERLKSLMVTVFAIPATLLFMVFLAAHAFKGEGK